MIEKKKNSLINHKHSLSDFLIKVRIKRRIQKKGEKKPRNSSRNADDCYILAFDKTAFGAPITESHAPLLWRSLRIQQRLQEKKSQEIHSTVKSLRRSRRKENKNAKALKVHTVIYWLMSLNAHHISLINMSQMYN